MPRIPTRIIVVKEGDAEAFYDTYWHAPGTLFKDMQLLNTVPEEAATRFNKLYPENVLNHPQYGSMERIEYREVLSYEQSEYIGTMLEHPDTTHRALVRHVVGDSRYRPTAPWPESIVQLDKLLNDGWCFKQAEAQNCVIHQPSNPEPQ